jgi:AcrR family transcriptional regulator
MPQGPTPTPRRAELEREARRLFAERGYHATSMEDLARAVGLRRGSLYAHIASKSELLVATVERGAEAFAGALDAALAAVPQGHVDRLRSALRAHVGVIAAEPDAAACFLWEWRHLAGAERARAIALRDAYQQRVRGLFADGVQGGAFRPDLDVGAAMLAFLSLGNWTATWYRADGPRTPDEIADGFCELLVEPLEPSARG